MASVLVPEFVTIAEDPGAPVVTVPIVIVAAEPVAPVPAGPVCPIGP